MKLATDGPYNL